jgi:hypothetical protein
MMAGGLFFLAFLVCILILWKLGMIKGQSAEKPAANSGTSPKLEIRHVGPGLAGQEGQNKLSGSWTGRYLDTLGGSGDADLSIQEEAGQAVSGRWNGLSLIKGRRAEVNLILWEGDQSGGPWRFRCRIHENSLLDVTYQSTSLDSRGHSPSGSAFLIPDTGVLGSRPDATSFAGLWTGFYSAGPETGITSISIQVDKSGSLMGAWNGSAPIMGAKLNGQFLEWECDKGGIHYRNVAGLLGEGNKLALIYCTSQGSDAGGYAGSALYTKNQ